MCVAFNSTISDFKQFDLPNLWKLTESYLNVGQTAYRVSKIEGKRIFLDSESSQSDMRWIAAKNFLYCGFAGSYPCFRNT